jgi:hypothetical protein
VGSELVARGTFEPILTPVGKARAHKGVALGRMAIAKTFRGDLQGSSKGGMLTAMTPQEGSAGYVAIERVTGSLHGRHGTFVLQHTGVMTRGSPLLAVAVVPDSGTGDLTGLAGTMDIKIDESGHSYEFRYSLTSPV